MRKLKNGILVKSVFIFSMMFLMTICSLYFIRDTDISGITASAEENSKEFKWTKKAVENGTTLDASYLWPDETDPVLTSVYRDGKLLSDRNMIIVTPGSVYHFRGRSNNAVLYTEVYVGSVSVTDMTSGESGTRYQLLPSSVRKSFEDDGWMWKTGWEYTGRAYLDLENKRIMIKDNDPAAVLYGMGLYLDYKYEYADDRVFDLEDKEFTDTFGSTENRFASALEYYYTRGGELESKCPKIYTVISDILSKLDAGTPGTSNRSETESETDSDNHSENESNSSESTFKTDLLTYVNSKRSDAGLTPVIWDSTDDENINIRVREVSELFSQTRPDGTEAFSAYTEAVMSEMRLENAGDRETIYECAESYFLMEDLKSFNCAVYDNTTVIIFVW